MVLIGFSLDNHLVQQIFYVGSAESKDVESTEVAMEVADDENTKVEVPIEQVTRKKPNYITLLPSIHFPSRRV